MTRRLAIFSFAVLTLGTFAGCAENLLTRERYDLIREGSSTKDEVKAALGEKYLIDRGKEWEYDNESEHLSVWFEFDERGVVKRKQWFSGDGIEHDSNTDPEGEKRYEGKNATTIDR